MRVDVFRIPHWFKVRFKVIGVDVVLRRPQETHLLEVLNGTKEGLFKADISQDFIEGNPPKPYRPAELELVIRRVLFDYIRRACTISTYRHPLFDIELLDYELIANPLPPIPPKAYTGPGPQELIAYTGEDGFYGEVPYTHLIGGDELIELLGIEGLHPDEMTRQQAEALSHPPSPSAVVGSSLNQEPWLKFKLGDRTVFVAKKNYLYATRLALHEANLITGNRVITIGRNQYRVKLLRGADPKRFEQIWELDESQINGYDVPLSHGSEWNRLMYPICEEHPNPEYHKTSQIGANWTGLAQTELGLGNESNFSLARDSTDRENIVRGGVAVTGTDLGLTQGRYGWRPVLELIDPANPKPEEPRVDPIKLPSSIAHFYGPGDGWIHSLDYDRVDAYMGEVSAKDLIDGEALAELIGLENGTAQNSDAGWLKFIHYSGILFVAKKNLRICTLEDLIEAQALFGERTLTIGGRQYVLRLLRGLNEDPRVPQTPPHPSIDLVGNYPTLLGFDLVQTHGSEWNDLLYRVTIEHRNPEYKKKSMSRYNWAFYSQDELNITSGLGSLSWTESAWTTPDYTKVVLRGQHAVTALSIVDEHSQAQAGWRPVLELVPVPIQP